MELARHLINIFPSSRISPSIKNHPIKTHISSSSSSSRNPISFLSSISPPNLITPTTAQLNSISTPTTKTTVELGIPTMSEIMEASKFQNIDIQLQTLGPFFRITATSLETNNKLGRAEGIIRVWWGGKILHLDSIRLQKETLSMEKSIYGIGLFIGAVAIRHGYDCGCRVAELLAINDSDLFHSKLVRFYTRIGFEAVHEVTGSSMGDTVHMLVWGGYGTRMNADIKQLLIKWGRRFKTRS